jgi:Pregnancy-associated plasma protein-A
MKRAHALVLALAIVAAVFAAQVGTASAAPRSSGSLQCGFYEQSPTFNALARLAPTSTARGGRLREKETRGVVSDSNVPASQLKTPPASFSATIHVYFHVITDGAEGDYSMTTIQQQMDVLNMAYAGFYGGANTGFQFDLAGVDYTDNADWYAQETPEAEVDMKAALKEGGPTDLNVYSTSGGPYLGWAYYPKIVVYKQYQVLDGIVIDGRSMPGGPYGDHYSLGHTLTHEAGHYLGLAHTFEQGCIGHGDYVDDTPAEAEPTAGCPEDKDTCPTPGLDPIHNYMDYSYDSCYDQFTDGQTTRMQQQWLHWREKVGYT